MLYTTTHRRIRTSRYVRRGLQRRRHTCFILPAHQLAVLAGRRTFVRQVLAAGLEPLGGGIYFDPATKCIYAAVTLPGARGARR